MMLLPCNFIVFIQSFFLKNIRFPGDFRPFNKRIPGFSFEIDHYQIFPNPLSWLTKIMVQDIPWNADICRAILKYYLLLLNEKVNSCLQKTNIEPHTVAVGSSQPLHIKYLYSFYITFPSMPMSHTWSLTLTLCD